MSDPFLRKVRVSNIDDAMRNSLRAALQHNKTYANNNVPQADRQAFRHEWAMLIKKSVKTYDRSVTDSDHCKTIACIAQILSERFSYCLADGRLRLGTSQKAFNLYLKFLWRLGIIPRPPHCPVDGIILGEAKLSGSWTKCDSADEYMVWINGFRRVAGKIALADWEYIRWKQ